MPVVTYTPDVYRRAPKFSALCSVFWTVNGTNSTDDYCGSPTPAPWWPNFINPHPQPQKPAPLATGTTCLYGWGFLWVPREPDRTRDLLQGLSHEWLNIWSNSVQLSPILLARGCIYDKILWKSKIFTRRFKSYIVYKAVSKDEVKVDEEVDSEF